MDRWLKKITSTTTTTSSSTSTNTTNATSSASASTSATQVQMNTPSTASTSNIPVEAPARLILDSYPQTDGRSFRSQWFNTFEWLEYDQDKDAAFCYPCRVYSVRETKEDCFSSTGFRNWKKALDKSKGFSKHEKTQAHLKNFAKWTEHKTRLDQNTEISTLVNDVTLEKNRYYVSSIFDVIRFIVRNELPFRGDYNKESHMEYGIFTELFEYTLLKDERLVECAKVIPKNATYKSPEIQNEMINLMALSVKEEIANEVNNADVPFFTIMVDGTRDKNNHECISICIRYVKDGAPVESLLTIENADSLKAEYCADLILNVLKSLNIDPNKILSQCYDGANVMSGVHGGVQKLIQNKLNRVIPYVHDFNHQLHLIITSVISSVADVAQFFDYCKMIHKIFSTFKFKEFYDGTATARLMEQRWSGHLSTTETVFKNYTKMITALDICLSKHADEIDGIDIVECRGLLTIMKTLKFRITLCAVLKLLRIIEPADKILQSEAIGLVTALPVIKSVHSSLEEHRSDATYNEVEGSAKELLPEAEREQAEEVEVISKRKIKRNRHLDAFILTESSGIHSQTRSQIQNANFKIMYFEIFDLTIAEFKRRFFNNTELYSVIDNAFNLDMEKLEHLRQYGIVLPTKEEAACVKNYFVTNGINKNFLQELHKIKQAFSNTYSMLAAVVTFGCSSVRCEASFSTLTRILTPFRRSMSFQRESNLVLLSFQRKTLSKIDNNILLRKLANNKDRRRLQLF